MQIEGAYAEEVMKLMEQVESKDALIQIARTHQHHTTSTLLQRVNNFYKSFQSETNKKHISSEHKIKMGRKRLHGQFPHRLDKKLVGKEQSY